DRGRGRDRRRKDHPRRRRRSSLAVRAARRRIRRARDADDRVRRPAVHQGRKGACGGRVRAVAAASGACPRGRDGRARPLDARLHLRALVVSAVGELARTHGFSGVVRVDRGDEVELAKAYGLADRAHGIADTLDTQFAIASGAKGLTALTAMTLVEDGTLSLATTARSVLGSDLPLIGDDVTAEHLLAHRSGIGDYLDEEVLQDVTAYVMPVPVR